MLRAACHPDRWTYFSKLKAGPHLLLPHDINSVPVASSYALCLHVSQPTRMGENGQTRDVRPGHVHLIPPGNELALALNGDAVRLFCVFLKPEFITQLAVEQNRTPPDFLSPRLAIEDPALCHLGLALRAAIKEDMAQDNLFADSVAQAMATRLLEHYGIGAREIVPKIRTASRTRIQKVITYIEDSLDENFGVDDLAVVAELTPFYFSRLFKQVTGKGPHQYVMERRLQKAVQLLRDNELTISEVAQRTGFSDQSHLGRHLRTSLGVTPRSLQQR
jgi:AraC family transcriptional regulator